jgi:hypothetical protein
MWTFNLFEAMARLGIKGGRQPALRNDAVGLALVAGNLSELTPPLLAPQAWFGNRITAVAGQRPGLSVQSNAPGGSFVEAVGLGASALSGAAWAVTAAEQNAAYAAAVTGFNMGPTACTALVQTGTAAAAQPTIWPRLPMAGTYWIPINGTIYLPPGYWFTVTGETVNVNWDWCMVVRDVPASLGSV